MESTLNLDRTQYIELLSRMISHTEKLQNQPPELVPTESLIADIVKAELKDCKYISIEEVAFVEGRPNLIIKYQNFNKFIIDNLGSVGFVGSHMDVVPADPKEWKHNPFRLTIDDKDPDILWGRGTTDCLGHVALLVQMLKDLSKNDIKLDYTLGVVLIADEEHGEDPTIGVSNLAKQGYLDFLKEGPVYWLDEADIYPVVGSGTGMSWELTTYGKRGHSGMTFNTINPILLSFEGVQSMLKVFKESFPEHPNEEKYCYECTSNMKPTQYLNSEGSINQIPDKTVVRGDVRLNPFHDWKEVQRVLNEHVEYLNQNIDSIPKLHESFPHKLEDDEMTKGRFELKWLSEKPYLGVLCDMESKGFDLLAESTKKYMGNFKVKASLGGLPLIAELKESGLDMQIMGYGIDEVYHANNEYCRYSGIEKGYQIMMDMIRNY